VNFGGKRLSLGHNLIFVGGGGCCHRLVLKRFELVVKLGRNLTAL
jgi:hypothetical protein